MIKAVICDDELATRNIICHFLEEEQLPIEIVGNAEDGEEAIQLIKETSPRLIFLDIHMPQKNGFQVIEEVSREVGAQIIVLTAFASFENAQQALRLGVSDILSKPVDFEQLKAAIFRAVGWKFTSNETVNLMLEYIHNHTAPRAIWPGCSRSIWVLRFSPIFISFGSRRPVACSPVMNAIFRRLRSGWDMQASIISINTSNAMWA